MNRGLKLDRREDNGPELDKVQEGFPMNRGLKLRSGQPYIQHYVGVQEGFPMNRGLTRTTAGLIEGAIIWCKRASR